MNTFITGRSAVEYWLRETLLNAYGTEPLRRRLAAQGIRFARTQAVGNKVVGDARLAEYAQGPLRGLSQPLEVLVAQPSLRSNTRFKMCRVWGRPLPSSSFVRIDSELYVALPEFAFCQMAHGLSAVGKVQLAYEFCASYVRSAYDARGFRKCAPLTTVSTLRSYLEEGVSDVRKRGRAAVLMRYVAGGSASPAETVLAALLFLPRSRGGFGIELGELNGAVELPSTGLPRSVRRRYVCDILWRGQGVAVEYDSDQWHTGAQRIAQDSRRRNELLDVGYSVITVTKQQLYDLHEFMRVGEQIAKALGKRKDNRSYSYDWHARYTAARRELFKTDGQWVTGV